VIQEEQELTIAAAVAVVAGTGSRNSSQ